MSGRSTHQSLQRAISILHVFSEHEPAIGVGEIARRLDLHKSTVSRILSTLLDEGMVWVNPETGKYSLGMSLVELAGVALGQIDVRGAAMPHMEALRATVGETVSVAVLRGQEAVTVAHLPAAQSVRHVVWIGRRIALRGTASGKVFLAVFRDLGQDWAQLADFESLGPEAAAWAEVMSVELDQVQRQGYATEIDEFEVGTSAVAAPIMDATGAVVAAISVGAPSFRFGAQQIAAAAPSVIGAAGGIAAELGMRYPVAQGGERLG